MNFDPTFLSNLLLILTGFGGAFVAALWIALVIWTYRDIRTRARDPLVQILSTLLVAVLNLPGILVYLILRPQRTLEEEYQRTLEEEALLQALEDMPLCPGCERRVKDDWQVECILVELYAEGLTGYGECVATRDPGYNYETAGTAWHILKDFVAPLLLGQEVHDAADFQRRVEGIRGHHLAKAGVEMALWDLLGKRTGNRSRKCLGAYGIRSKWGCRSASSPQPQPWSEPRKNMSRRGITVSRSRSSPDAMSKIRPLCVPHFQIFVCRWMLTRLIR
jgi:hypothetical protein